MNTDNVIFNEQENRIHFIDLHRSRMMDYVQDVSVFLVSNYRLPAFDVGVRRRIERVTREFLAFASDFAKETGDTSFGARLGLGLARSFATSARFVLDDDFAKSMFLRARYLLEQLMADPDPESGSFVIPGDVLLG